MTRLSSSIRFVLSSLGDSPIHFTVLVQLAIARQTDLLLAKFNR